MGNYDAWNYTQPVGLDSFLPRLLMRLGVSAVSTHTINRPPSLQSRSENPLLETSIANARQKYVDAGTPFWNAMLEQARAVPVTVRRAILDEALFHPNDEAGSKENTDLETFSKLVSSSDYAENPDGRLTTLESGMIGSSAILGQHLPMLDFRLRSDTQNHSLAVDILGALNLEGYLINSGRSYHFYGAELVSANNLWEILGRAQLLGPLIDQRWIAHQMISGRCALRVSSDDDRHAKPVLIATTEEF